MRVQVEPVRKQMRAPWMSIGVGAGRQATGVAALFALGLQISATSISVR